MAFEQQNINYPKRFTRGAHFVVKPNEPRQSHSAAPHQFDNPPKEEEEE
jgi:hypothetical protein